MKNRRFTPMLIAAGLLSSMNLGLAWAQPDAAPAAKTKKERQPRRRPAVNKRLVTAIETKTGKTLTDEQKVQLADAAKARQEAVAAAMEKYLADTAAITGLTVEDMREIQRPARRNAAAANAANAPKPEAAPAAAPAPAPAPAPPAADETDEE